MIQPIKPRKTAKQVVVISKHTETCIARNARIGIKAAPQNMKYMAHNT